MDPAGQEGVKQLFLVLVDSTSLVGEKMAFLVEVNVSFLIVVDFALLAGAKLALLDIGAPALHWKELILLHQVKT